MADAVYEKEKKIDVSAMEELVSSSSPTNWFQSL